MKKFAFIAIVVMIVTACGSMKVYNKGLQQIELGMTKEQVVSVMDEDYKSYGKEYENGNQYETIEYKDMYKNHFFFQFENNKLYKWYKETETKK